MIQRISYEQVKLEGGDLLSEYAKECSIPGLPPINPHWGMYELLEASGGYQVFAAYAGETMVGFAGILTMVNPHYSRVVATVESLFVSKAHRHGAIAARLMEAIEEHANAVGCIAILYSAPAGGALEAVLGKRIPRSNAVFCKPLGADA